VLRRLAKLVALAVCATLCLKSGEAQESQTTIQQSLIDVNVVDQQILKSAPKIGQIAP
jgi:hypothetical protein